MKQASLRIDVGGKLLTNLFCEMISTKDFNLQGEFMIVNDIKEKTCFMAEDTESFNQDMESGKSLKKELSCICYGVDIGSINDILINAKFD